MAERQVTSRCRWLGAALAVSLVLNLGMLGMVGGIILRAGDQGSVLRAAVSALPSDDRRALRRETRAIWRDMRGESGGGSGGRSAAQDMIAVLQAEEFDADAFGDSLQQAQDRFVQISTEMHARLITRVSAMSAEERRSYADALQEQMSKRRWQGRDGQARSN